MIERSASRPSGQRWPAGCWLLTVVLYAPLGVQAWRHQSGRLYYGETLHWTGEWAIWLLLLTLAVTPLRRIFGSCNWTNWLLRRRRDLGVAMFAYSLALTSNDRSMRLLRGHWKRLHRLVYPAAILVMVHWYGTAFSPVAACWHTALLLLLFLLRWPRSWPGLRNDRV